MAGEADLEDRVTEVRVEEGVQTVTLLLQTNPHNKTPSQFTLDLGMPAIHQGTTSLQVNMQPPVLAGFSRSPPQQESFSNDPVLGFGRDPPQRNPFQSDLIPGSLQGILHLLMLAFLVVHHGMAQSQ